MSFQTVTDDSGSRTGTTMPSDGPPVKSMDTSQGTGAQLLRDLLTLTKPRIVFLILLTATVGYVMGGGHLAGMLLWHNLIGVGLLCAGSAALNQVMEHDRDALMVRTRKRPVAAQRISPTTASVFGATLTIVGAAWLVATVNWLTAAIGVLTAITYLAVYTPLKLKTTWSIFFGAVAGSLPPVMGWTAAQGSIGWGAIALFAIMMVWQVPHSFAIAILYRDDYSHADFAVAELAKRDEHVLARQIQLYTLLMIVLAAAPWALNLNGMVYLVGAILLGLGFLFVGVPLRRGEATAYARRVFHASLVYLPVLFIWMAVTRSSG
ncbi:MAG: protoheme IX farnesyltransferase [candidate division Zixibacteria bacterium]|nr:protoheme IX farnesyltransferase [candidate division Zixibacteria bacterium]